MSVVDLARYKAEGFKKTVTTYNKDVLAFFAKNGCKTKLLYEADDIARYEVTVHGRKEIALLQSEDFAKLTQAAAADIYTVVPARIRPILYTLTLGGIVCSAKAKDGADILMLSHDKELLLKVVSSPDGTRVEGLDAKELGSWEAVCELLTNAKKNNFPTCRCVIGFGPHALLPYEETYPTNVLLACAEQAVSQLEAMKNASQEAIEGAGLAGSEAIVPGNAPTLALVPPEEDNTSSVPEVVRDGVVPNTA